MPSGTSQVTPVGATSNSAQRFLQVPALTRLDPRPLAVAFLIDITGSYTPELRLDAQRHVAGWVETIAANGRCDLTLFVSLLSSDSYPDEQTVQVVDHAACPPAPALPELEATPTIAEAENRLNPLEQERLAATATAAAGSAYAANATAQAGYAAEVATREATIDEARHGLGEELETLAAFDVETDWGPGTDVWGALARAAERLSAQDGERLVIIASDLMMNERQGRYDGIDLGGSRVIVINFACDDAANCEQLRVVWREELTALGALEVRFFDPGETDTLTVEIFQGQ
ncbi:MAG: hypothetical protein R3A46_15055 [Thermomicrobiales bacterium]